MTDSRARPAHEQEEKRTRLTRVNRVGRLTSSGERCVRRFSLHGMLSLSELNTQAHRPARACVQATCPLNSDLITRSHLRIARKSPVKGRASSPRHVLLCPSAFRPATLPVSSDWPSGFYHTSRATPYIAVYLSSFSRLFYPTRIRSLSATNEPTLGSSNLRGFDTIVRRSTDRLQREILRIAGGRFGKVVRRSGSPGQVLGTESLAVEKRW